MRQASELVGADESGMGLGIRVNKKEIRRMRKEAKAAAKSSGDV